MKKPDNWRKWHQEGVSRYANFVRGYAEDWNDAIDIGGEVMMEALKEKGARLEGYSIQIPAGGKLSVGQVDIPFILGTNLGKGWLVFIEEE